MDYDKQFTKQGALSHSMLNSEIKKMEKCIKDLRRCMNCLLFCLLITCVAIVFQFYKYHKERDAYIKSQRIAVWDCHDNFMKKGWDNAANEVLFLLPATEEK